MSAVASSIAVERQIEPPSRSLVPRQRTGRSGREPLLGAEGRDGEERGSREKIMGQLKRPPRVGSFALCGSYEENLCLA